MNTLKFLPSFVLLFLFNADLAAQVPTGISVNFYVRTFPSSNVSNVTLNPDTDYILESLVSGFVCANESLKWTIYGTGTHTISNLYAASPTIRLTPGTYTVELWAGTTPASALEFCGASNNSKKKVNYITVPYTRPVAKYKTNGVEIPSVTVPLNSNISFADASTNYPTSWLWTVNPSSGWSYTSGNSTSKNSAIKFTTSGNYTVSLKASNPADNHTVTKTNHVVVQPGPPTANFNANGSSANPVNTVQNTITSLNDLSTNVPTAWEWTISPSTGWSFSAGNKNTQNPKVNFTTTGLYTVALKATNAGGNTTETKTNYIKVTPPAPTVVSPVTYCRTDVANVLSASGTGLRWYTNASGGTATSVPPTPSTANTGTFSYYVSQTINSIESPRAQLNVVVNALPAAPMVNSLVNYCVGSTASALTASGTSLKWYTTGTGGTGNITAPIPSTAVAGTTNYYVSQTNANNCEGPRSQITVKVSVSLDAPVVITPAKFCLGYPATALTAAGSGLKWYNVSSGGTALAAAPVPSTAVAGTTNYYVAQTAPGCPEGPRALLAVTINNGAPPTAPTVNSPVTYMQATNTMPLTAVGTALKWYDAGTGGDGSTTAPIPLTAAAGTTAYYVSQTNANCEGPRAQIDVIVTPTPGGTADWVWAKHWHESGTSTYNGKAVMATDSAGNMYITGSFIGSINFGSTTLTSTPLSQADLYVAKYDAGGGLLWARKASGGVSAEYVNDITVDDEGNYYLCGYYKKDGGYPGGSVFGAFTLTNNTIYKDIFVVKYDSAGVAKWASKYINNGFTFDDDEAFAIEVDTAGKVYVVGSQIKFANNIGSYTAVPLMYSPTGVQLTQGAGIVPQEQFLDVALDGYGNTYTVGITENPRKIYLTKFDGGYGPIWERRIANDLMTNYKLKVDRNGNSYLLGTFHSNSPITFGNITLTGRGSYDLFIVKYDAAGQVVWAKSGGGTGTDQGGDIALDRFGNCFITGVVSGNATFDNVTVTSPSIYTYFAAKYNPQGEIIWVQKALNNLGDAFGGIGLDKVGNSYVTGYYATTGVFGSTTLNKTGANKFMAKLGSAIPVQPEIFTDPLKEETYIAGENLNVAFSASGSFGNDNVFTAELSDDQGSFSNPVIIGTASINPIKATIPALTPAGLKYRIRVVASQPDIRGTDNGNNIVINDAAISPAPDWVWAKKSPEGRMSTGFLRSIIASATDSVGNTYIATDFFNYVTLGGTTLNSSGATDIFIAKYNAAGELQWFRKTGGAGEEQVRGIAIDGLGNYYLTGGFKGTSTFGAISLTNTTTYYDLFTVKFNNAGIAQWAKKYEGSNAKDDIGFGIAVDAAGNNIYVAAESDEYILIATNTYDSWQKLTMIKYDASGQQQWLKQPSGYRIDEVPHGIAIDAVGNVYTAGMRTVTTPSVGNFLFAYRFDNAGNQRWVRASNSIGYGYYGIANDGKGTSYVTGRFPGFLDIGGLTSTSDNLNAFFLVKMDSLGNSKWIKTGGGPDYDDGLDVVTDKNGNAYVTGTFQHTATFDSISLTNSNSGRSDVFVAKYDTLGKLRWIKKAGLNGTDQATSITTDDVGNSYITGLFGNNIQFGDTLLTGGGSFIAKINAEPVPDQLSFTPQVGDGGTSVIIKGSGFNDVTEVAFNNLPAASFTVDSANQITAIVGAGTTTGPVSVTSLLGGKGSSNSNFTIIDTLTGTVQLCPPSGNTVLTANLSGSSYQWQLDSGNGFINITNDLNYQGTNTRSLNLNGIPASWNGYQYRCVVDGMNSKILKLEFLLVWTGVINSTWENANNWSCGIIPDKNSRIYLNSDAVVTVSSNVTLKSMTVRPGASITVKPGYNIVLSGE